MSLPKFPVEGGCQCGAVRYRLTDNPLSVYNCHCKDCQRYSGAGWSMSMPIRSDTLELLGGELVQVSRTADSGRVLTMNFCARCYTWLFNQPPAADLLVMRAGSLDDMDWAQPVGNIWTDSKAVWAPIDDAQVNFPGQPDSREPLYDAWAALHEKDL